MGTKAFSAFALALMISATQVNSSFADPGGVMVDDDDVCDSNHEEGILSSLGGADGMVVWINSATPPSVYRMEIWNNGANYNGGKGGIKNQQLIAYTSGMPIPITYTKNCSDKWYAFDFRGPLTWYFAGTYDDPPAVGSYTLKVLEYPTNKNIGSDSFRIQ